MRRKGEIKKVGDLFDVYRKRLKPPQGSVIRSFVEVVDEVLGLTIKEAQVSYSVGSKTLHLRVPAPMKSEIKLHEGELLAHLAGRLGERGAPKHIV